MVQLQIISKILETNDYSFIENNLLDESFFTEYVEEFNFITEHYKQYGNVPDKATFLSKFRDIELVAVNESEDYLLHTLHEENLYYRAVPIIKKAAEMLQTDSNEAAEFLVQSLNSLQPRYNLGGTDIISDANNRYDKFEERKNNQNDWYFTTGFEELDDTIHGFQRGEELVVIVARTNQGKSWVLEKMCTHIWEIGFNVGYISPEMSADSIGYRFDTLHNNYSNKALMWGNNSIDSEEYKEYVSQLSEKDNKFIVATPIDFDRRITVTKLKNFIKQHNLDVLAVDGITYITDERGKRNDNKTTSLTNISEDLMSLSIEVGIPILVVVQANRSGAVADKDADGTPELESIRDSDGIAHNASKVLSIRQKGENVLEIGIKKQRFGAVGGKLNYQWDIDVGNFEFVPSYDDCRSSSQTDESVTRERKKYNDATDVF